MVTEKSVPELLELLEHALPGVRCMAALNLCMRCRDGRVSDVAGVVAKVAARLADPIAAVRELTCYALHRVGEAVVPVLPTLAMLLTNDPVPAVREAAARSLGTLGAEKVAIPVGALRDALDDKQLNVSEAAQWALDQLPRATA